MEIRLGTGQDRTGHENYSNIFLWNGTGQVEIRHGSWDGTGQDRTGKLIQYILVGRDGTGQDMKIN